MAWFKRQDTGPKGGQQKEVPDGLWVKCPSCQQIIYRKKLDENLWLCPICGHHFRIGVGKYIELIMDDFDVTDDDILSVDPLNFVDSKPYPKRLEDAKEKSGHSDAVIVGTGHISGIEVSAGFMDFSFIGGSMGSVVGERITRAIERATDMEIPMFMMCASGGARMQESILSLMQMAKTSAALAYLNKKGLPYITLLTHPTTAGVMASFASLGDVTLAEPKALLGFAGPRVIEQTIGKKLPDDFQTSEFFLEHGFVDVVVKRPDLKKTISTLLKHFTSNR